MHSPARPQCLSRRSRPFRVTLHNHTKPDFVRYCRLTNPQAAVKVIRVRQKNILCRPGRLLPEAVFCFQQQGSFLFLKLEKFEWSNPGLNSLFCHLIEASL
jgi:hypothetical protein